MSKPVAVITGASSGIGRSCAEVFAQRGYTVVISARNQDKLEHLASALSGQGHDVLTVVADVSKEDDCKHLMEETLRHYRRIDVLINNAGLSMRALFETADLSVLHRLMDTNF